MALVAHVGIHLDSAVLLKQMSHLSTTPHPATTINLFSISFADDYQAIVGQQVLERLKFQLDGEIAIQFEGTELDGVGNPHLRLKKESCRQVLAWRNVLYQLLSDGGFVEAVDSVDVLPLPGIPLDKSRVKWNDNMRWMLHCINEDNISVTPSKVGLVFPAREYQRPSPSCIALSFGDGDTKSQLEPLATDGRLSRRIPFLALNIETDEQVALLSSILEKLHPDLVDVVRPDMNLGNYIKSLEWESKIVVDNDDQRDDAYLVPTASSLAQFDSWYKLLYARLAEANLVDTSPKSDAYTGMWMSKTRVRLFAKNDTFCPNENAHSTKKAAVFHLDVLRNGKFVESIHPHHHGNIPKDNAEANLLSLLTSPEFWRSPNEARLTYEEVYRLTHVHQSWNGYEWTSEMCSAFVEAVNVRDGIHRTSRVIDLPVPTKDDKRSLTFFCIAALYSAAHQMGISYGFPVSSHLGSGYAVRQYLYAVDSLKFALAKFLEAQCGQSVVEVIEKQVESKVVKVERWHIPYSFNRPMAIFFNGKIVYSLLRALKEDDWCVKPFCTSAHVLMSTAEYEGSAALPACLLHIRCIAPTPVRAPTE